MSAASCGRIGFELQPGDPDAAASAIDAAEVIDLRLSCERGAENLDVALYDFDDDLAGVIVDALGNNSGTTVGNVVYVDGPVSACGRAIQFSASTQGYGLIADSPAWQLADGSVDFWFRASSYPPDLAGMLSRDAGGTSTPGHLGIFLDSTGRVGFRLQEQDAVQTFGGGVCSEAGAVVLGEWNHLGINFGSDGTELWLNGSVVDEPGNLDTVLCQTGNAIGINGNANPWTIGINSGTSEDGMALPVIQPFEGAMDHLRISSSPRKFSGPAYAKPD
jgi:hypothetical protein